MLCAVQRRPQGGPQEPSRRGQRAARKHTPGLPQGPRAYDEEEQVQELSGHARHRARQNPPGRNATRSGASWGGPLGRAKALRAETHEKPHEGAAKQGRGGEPQRPAQRRLRRKRCANGTATAGAEVPPRAGASRTATEGGGAGRGRPRPLRPSAAATARPPMQRSQRPRDARLRTARARNGNGGEAQAMARSGSAALQRQGTRSAQRNGCGLSKMP